MLCTLITVQIKSAVLIAVALWTLQPRNLAPLPDSLSTSLAHSVCPWRFSESPYQHQREFLCSGGLIRERSLLPFIFSVSLHYLGLTGKIKRFEQLGNNKALTVHKEQVKGCLEYLSIPWVYLCLCCEVAYRHPQGRSRLEAAQEALGKLKQRTIVGIMGFIYINFSEYIG